MGLRWEKSKVEVNWWELNLDRMSPFEDLQESPNRYDYEREDAIWVIEVRGRVGLPRPVYGALVMVLNDDGELLWRLDV